MVVGYLFTGKENKRRRQETINQLAMANEDIKGELQQQPKSAKKSTSTRRDKAQHYNLKIK